MRLKEYKEKIDAMYKKYGDIVVAIDLTQDEEVDDTVYKDKDTGNILTENIQDITELKDNKAQEVVGICISNYVMEDKNWGRKEE